MKCSKLHAQRIVHSLLFCTYSFLDLRLGITPLHLTVMADVECPICLVTLCCEGGGEVMSLSCAHSFHKDCFATYCATTNVSMDTVKCPCCKRTSADVAALQTASTVPDDNNEGLVISDDDAALQTSSSASGNGAASARVGMTHPVFDAPTVFCSYCGSQAAVQKCRLTAKAAGRWQCNSPGGASPWLRVLAH